MKSRAAVLKAASLLLSLAPLSQVSNAETRLNPPPTPAPAALSSSVFDRFKSLEGHWIGASTKGWTETVDYRVIAAGSAVMYTSFDAHPNETMATFIHPDGERLLLTHYCVAKNQPRLVLTSAAPDLSEATFEFLDGTNLSTRDRGHMDKVVFRFATPDSFTSQWTWYQDGKENWMEEIRLTRDRDPSATK